MTAAQFGYPFTQEDLRVFVRDNYPGKRPVAIFFTKKWRSLYPMSENVKRSCAEITPKIIRNYFSYPENIIADVLAANIINYHETNISDDPGKT